jgi:hypothetical protein
MKDPNISKRVNYTAKGYTGHGHLLREIFVSDTRATEKILRCDHGPAKIE